MRTSRSPGGTRFLARLAGSAIGLALAAATAAAQTGVVSGTVIEASSGRGLPAVRVQIVGNEIAAASSDANGHFTIRNAPSGAQTVRATQIGYRPESRSITIGADTVRVEAGASVAPGEPIGTVGDTGSLSGPRLYFEIREGSEAVDPLRWLANRGRSARGGGAPIPARRNPADPG